jgi:hypothetical protein
MMKQPKLPFRLARLPAKCREIWRGPHRLRLLVPLLVVASILVGTTTAATLYQAPTESRANVFTVGKVLLTLTEPDFPRLEPDKLILWPNREIAKNPTIKNTGESDAYIFMVVEMPLANVRTVTPGVLPAADTVNAAALQPLFMLYNGATPGVHSDWYLISNTSTSDVQTLVYGFRGAVTGKPNGVTSPGWNLTVPFTKVKMINILEGEIPKGTQIDMPVSAVAIQSGFLGESGTTIEQKLTSAWTIYSGIDQGA